MKIAIIGWGSLIWDRGKLKLASGEWYDDGPHLPIEFARISNGGRLTLVIMPGLPRQQTLWAVSAMTSSVDAREDLRLREGPTRSRNIHSLDRSGKRIGEAIPEEVLTEMGRWLEAHPDIDAAIWTGLQSNWESRRGAAWSMNDAIEYLQGLDGRTLEDAKRYIENAPRQIDTDVRRKVQEVIGWR